MARRLWRRTPRRPKGGRADTSAQVPPTPTPASGQAPDSPAGAFASLGVAPPRPLVWLGESAAGCQVWSSPVADRAGQQMWSQLGEVADQAGAWPLLTGEHPLPVSWHLEQATPTSGALPDPEALLVGRLAELDPPPVGFPTRLEPNLSAVVETDLAPGYLALVTGVEGWQVPLAVGLGELGGWSASEHASIWHHWSLAYQARLVALTDSGVGLLIGRPPTTHEAAMAAAEQIYAYCPDVVTHGVGSMWALATTIAVSPAWSLRWTG